MKIMNIKPKKLQGILQTIMLSPFSFHFVLVTETKEINVTEIIS